MCGLVAVRKNGREVRFGLGRGAIPGEGLGKFPPVGAHHTYEPGLTRESSEGVGQSVDVAMRNEIAGLAVDDGLPDAR